MHVNLDTVREVLQCAALVWVCYPRPHAHPMRLISLVLAVATAICLLLQLL